MPVNYWQECNVADLSLDLIPKITHSKFIAGTLPEEYDTFPRAHRLIGKHTDSNSGGGECSIVFHPLFGDFPA